MAEYIEFEATKQAIDRIRSVYYRARNFNAVSVIDNVFGEIKEIPAADVAPVVHGRWECGCQCSVCVGIYAVAFLPAVPRVSHSPDCGFKAVYVGVFEFNHVISLALM